jgi:glycopeptide antibiotics resistance protein
MKKFLILFSIIFVTVIAIFISNKNIAFAATRFESTIPQSGDLCGGTGGNGQIRSVGSNTFTLKLNADGKKGNGNLIVNLTEHATIKTSNGSASVSDLKIGDRVTLVGDNHRDGTFTADAVVVCSSDQNINAPNDGTGKIVPIAVRNKNPKEYEKVSGIVNMGIYLLVGFVWLGMVTFLLLKKKKNLIYILFFTLFYIYLYKVFDYTLLQFQSLLFLQHFVPDLMLNGFKDGTNVNVVPLATLTLEDLNTSFLNILMMIPFGFGLPFITKFRMKKIVVLGLLLSITIEFLQLITGFMANTTFRVADINDLIFNTIGVAIGYVLFVVFVRSYRHLFPNWRMLNPVFRYIAERPQIDARTK